MKAQIKHGNKYIYDKVRYKNNTIKVKIKCKVKGHGYFEQIPRNHLSGQGCKKCGIEQRLSKRRMTTEQFIAKAIEVHGDDAYDYSKV